MINVSCAIIINEENSVLITQRSSVMQLPLKWEFPGGKVEEGETAEEALLREIKEELDVEIEILQALRPNCHSYDTKTIRLIPFVCKISLGSIHLREHAAHLWLKPNELLDLDWAEADIPIVKAFLDMYDEI